MFVALALIAAASLPTRVSAACEVGEWSEWSACAPKAVFTGCEYAAGAPAWRAPLEVAAVNQKATPNLRGPDNAAAVANMMLKMKRQGEALARATTGKPIERGPATCEDGDADGFGCLGVDLESWTPIARLGPSASRPSSTNDNWGWTSAEGREWALQCADNGAGQASADGHAFRTWKRDEPQFL
jgi:hypothetical protein